MRAGMKHCNAHIYTVCFQNLYTLDLILHAWSAKFLMLKRCTSRCHACDGKSVGAVQLRQSG